MRRLLLIGGLVLIAFGIYALDRGIYVGTSDYWFDPAPCCPDEGRSVLRKCRYLFVTGIAEITAHDGLTTGIGSRYGSSAYATPNTGPRGYCSLFGIWWLGGLVPSAPEYL